MAGQYQCIFSKFHDLTWAGYQTTHLGIFSLIQHECHFQWQDMSMVDSALITFILQILQKQSTNFIFKSCALLQNAWWLEIFEREPRTYKGFQTKLIMGVPPHVLATDLLFFLPYVSDITVVSQKFCLRVWSLDHSGLVKNSLHLSECYATLTFSSK